jgi:hypothetical protein
MVAGGCCNSPRISFFALVVDEKHGRRGGALKSREVALRGGIGSKRNNLSRQDGRRRVFPGRVVGRYPPFRSTRRKSFQPGRAVDFTAWRSLSTDAAARVTVS